MSDSDAPDAIELHPEDYSVDELRAVVFGDSARLPRVFALNLLRRKEYPDRVADLERLIGDGREAPSFRRQAAIELGRLPSDEATAALERASSVDHIAVRETVARELAARPGAAGAAHPAARAWAAKLDAIRRGAPHARFVVPGPERLLPMAMVEATIDVTVEPAAKELTERAVRDAGNRLIAEPSTASALLFSARRTAALFVPAARTAVDIARLQDAPAILGSVLLRHSFEADRWEVGYHVVTQPAEQGAETFDLLVVRPNGQPAFAGRVTSEEGSSGARLRFRVGAVDAPGGFPIDVTGTFGTDGIELDQVRVGTIASTVTPQPRRR